MKIIITESQKKKLMNDFMKSLVDDTLDENEPSYVDSYIVIWDKTVDGGIDDATAIEYDKSDGRLWISKKYLNNLESWFPIKKEKVLDMIKNSFENKFNVDVKYIKAES
jgi:hypothetical protein